MRSGAHPSAVTDEKWVHSTLLAGGSRWSFEDGSKRKPEVTTAPIADGIFDRVYQKSEYEIETCAEYDDEEIMTPFRRRLYRIAPLVTLASVAVYFVYFAFRIICIIDTQRKNNRIYVLAWFFVAAEIQAAIPSTLYYSFSFLSLRGRKRPKLRLRGNRVPTVDVLITCCGEDVDVILDTARAACFVDYPSDRFRVIVCDDANDPEIKIAVRKMRRNYDNLYYFARVKGAQHHYKAGNLIASTDFVARLPHGPAEMIAALDADMIPERMWLRATVAHIVNDDKMAMSCPPQLFYNVPENDPLVQSLDSFGHVVEPNKDANGVAWCTGSGYVVRRAAIDSIGGWPVGSLAEDVYFSSRLLGQGWKTAYVHEPLQFGTVPDTFVGHIKQRTRWTLGSLQTAAKLNFNLYGKVVREMTFSQRLSGIMFAADNLLKIFTCIGILTIPVVLLSGGTLVPYSNYDQLRLQIRLCFASMILVRLQLCLCFVPSGYRLSMREAGVAYWMTPYHTLAIIRGFLLPNWLGGTHMAFSASGSLAIGLAERDAKLRAPRFERFWSTLSDAKLYIHVTYMLLVLGAVGSSIYRSVTQKHNTTNNILLYNLTHAAWPPLAWLTGLFAAGTPLRYIIWPPTMPPREELLDRDPRTGVARPKEQYKSQRWTAGFWRTEAVWTFCTLYITVLFVGTFVV